MPRSMLGESEYRTLVEKSPVMIWRSNAAHACDYFNACWLSFTGRRLEQELGKGWTAGVHPDDRQHCVDVHTAAFKQRTLFELEYRLRRADGEYRWILDRAAPFEDASGAFAGFIGSCLDVNHRIQVQTRMDRMRDTEMRMLRGLLPICAWCRKIRDDGGYWKQIEDYISARSQAKFSHGICPDCRRVHFPHPDE